MEKDLLRLLQACVGIVVLLGTAILVFTLFPTMNSEVAAAWVQAIGAIVAILSGITVVRYQLQEETRVRREEEALRVYRLLTSLRTEVELLRKKLVAGLGAELSALPEAKPLMQKLHFVPEQFVVFDSHVANFGSISSDALRGLLIEGYASFRGLLFSVEINTLTVEELDAELFANNGKLPTKRKAIYQERFRVVGRQIRERHAEASKLADELLIALADDVLRKHFNIPIG